MAQKFITKPIEAAILKTPYGSTDGVPLSEKKVIARFFNPYGRGTWYVLENSDFADNRIVFGAVDLGYGLELGDFSIEELENIRVNVFGTKMPLERDISVVPLANKMEYYIKMYNHEEM